VVTHLPYWLTFKNTCAVDPIFLVSMQTSNGLDPADVRWHNKQITGIQIHISEEQSADKEVDHVQEAVGYITIVK
jgi:hypothetical protein